MNSGQDRCCIFACSGSSSVGRLTNNLALRLARESVGTVSCLAGVDAHRSGFVMPAEDCERLVLLDGCDHRCGVKTLEHAKAKPPVDLNLTEHGFVKKHGVLSDEAELERAHALATDRLKGAACSTAS